MRLFTKDTPIRALLKKCFPGRVYVSAILLLGALSASAQREWSPPPPPPPPPPLAKRMEIFKYVERMPRFPGCEDEATEALKNNCAREKMMTFIYRSIRYPEVARKNGLTGEVVANFIINIDGTIANVNIIRNIGGGCGAEVARVIESMNASGIRFTPPGGRGQPRLVRFQIVVSFTREMMEKKEY